MTAFVAASNAFVLPSSSTFMNQRMGSMRMAMSSSSFVDSINGKYLLSVQECINSQKEEEEEEGSKVIFVDGSWHLTPDRDGREEFEKGPRIKDARFFDIDDISSKGTLNPKGLPHMCPPKVGLIIFVFYELDNDGVIFFLVTLVSNLQSVIELRFQGIV